MIEKECPFMVETVEEKTSGEYNDRKEKYFTYRHCIENKCAMWDSRYLSSTIVGTCGLKK